MILLLVLNKYFVIGHLIAFEVETVQWIVEVCLYEPIIPERFRSKHTLKT